MSVVIRVENLSKYYRLGEIGGGTLREDLNRWWARVRGRPDPGLKVGESDHGNRQGDEIWALRDVSFEVREGEILGVIGRNGAGKSTLLKILSRITAPTSGRALIKGRVGSLLEVGTGFHPELTGRENIYLNGAILGMKKAEIGRKLDEIIDFAEIEQFIDTPVKRYSSGMYVRLAFAVAAHLEPEILIVDEVLAVGDAAFQKKCLGKMDEVAKKQGRTILFVSHNMPAILNITSKCIFLENGAFAAEGLSSIVVQRYLSANTCNNTADLKDHKNRILNGSQALNSVSIHGLDGHPIVCGNPAIIEIKFDRNSIPSKPEVAFTVETLLGQRAFSFATYWSTNTQDIDFSQGIATCFIDKLALIPGLYLMNVAVGTTANPFQDHIPKAIQFEVNPSDYYGTGKIPSSQHGVVLLDAIWC